MIRFGRLKYSADLRQQNCKIDTVFVSSKTMPFSDDRVNPAQYSQAVAAIQDDRSCDLDAADLNDPFRLPLRMRAVTVYTVDPLLDNRWDDLVTRHPNASAFHQRGWLEALSRTYGYKPIVFTTSPPSAE